MDQRQAGQTVAHVHVQILPRKDGDFENNDEIYDAIDAKGKELKGKLDLDKERKDRSMEEMCKEAEEYSIAKCLLRQAMLAFPSYTTPSNVILYPPPVLLAPHVPTFTNLLRPCLHRNFKLVTPIHYNGSAS
ncbi:Bis(5'-adenosyl)-triphosphatase [Hibiscus syriacus]|uniref:Bis(5'-adenosyl)-triphosphatase n=1 Tax=Hibiscus syriacus TaxID=106335 RepID=A0A6A2YH58_HIBSY|nr:Bis(5'-adenosyl)-triphosphatase [Hibiscus syriacus]